QALGGGARPAPITYLPRLLWAVVRANGLAAAALALITVVSGSLPTVQLTVLGRLTGQVRELEGLGSAGWSVLLPTVALFAGIMLFDGVLQLLSPVLETALRESLGIRTQREVIEKAQSLPLVTFEHPEFYDR